jgi:hypothetical protein
MMKVRRRQVDVPGRWESAVGEPLEERMFEIAGNHNRENKINMNIKEVCCVGSGLHQSYVLRIKKNGGP